MTNVKSRAEYLPKKNFKGLNFLQGNCLKIVDRMKHIFKLSQGEYVAPERIEQIYSQSPFIQQILVDGSPLCSYPVALVVPNSDSICKTLNLSGQQSASDNNGNSEIIHVNGKSFTLAELCNNSQAEQLIYNDITQLGKASGLKGFEQVRAHSGHHHVSG